MPPRCHVDRCISQEARGGGTSWNPFPTPISLVDGFRGVFDSAIKARVLTTCLRRGSSVAGVMRPSEMSNVNIIVLATSRCSRKGARRSVADASRRRREGSAGPRLHAGLDPRRSRPVDDGAQARRRRTLSRLPTLVLWPLSGARAQQIGTSSTSNPTAGQHDVHPLRRLPRIFSSGSS